MSLDEKTVAIVQARMGSTRLPGKSMQKIGEKTLLRLVLDRLKESDMLFHIVVATTNRAEDDILVLESKKARVGYFRGSDLDVLQRIAQAARANEADVVVRICADNSFLAVGCMDRMIKHHIAVKNDLTYNGVHEKGVPPGFVSEVVSIKALDTADSMAQESDEREHVTLYLKRNPDKFRIEAFEVPHTLRKPHLQLSIDTESDLNLVRRINSVLRIDKRFVSAEEILRVLEERPELLSKGV